MVLGLRITFLSGLAMAVTSLCACVSSERGLPRSVVTSESVNEIAEYTLRSRRNHRLFERDGPFSFRKISDFSISLNPDKKILTDLYLSDAKGKSPLLIFVHGNKSYKETHSNQAERASTWGFHALVLDLPNQNQWMINGKTVGQLAKLLYVWPSLLSDRIDINQMILVGHSFGGSASSIAVGSGAPVRGLILLDPALVSDKVVRYLERIDVPTLILGADRKVFRSRRRDFFFRKIRSKVFEVSLKGAGHYDAEYPSRNELRMFGIDFGTSQDRQDRFTASILLGAFSMSGTGTYDMAWNKMRGRNFKAYRKK